MEWWEEHVRNIPQIQYGPKDVGMWIPWVRRIHGACPLVSGLKGKSINKLLPGSCLRVRIQGNVYSKSGEGNFIHGAVVFQWCKVMEKGCHSLGGAREKRQRCSHTSRASGRERRTKDQLTSQGQRNKEGYKAKEIAPWPRSPAGQARGASSNLEDPHKDGCAFL